MKKKIKQYVCRIEDSFFTGKPEDVAKRLLNFKTEINDLSKEIEGLDNFTIEFDEAIIELHAERLETDSEYENRINRENRQEQLSIANRNAQEEKERILLAQLKSKYENKE